MKLAIALFIASINPYLNDNQVITYTNYIARYCKQPYLAATVIQAESSFRSDAIHHNTNGTKDVGLFQINSVHGYDRALLLDANSSIYAGCSMLDDGSYRHSNNRQRQAKYETKLARILVYGAFSSSVTEQKLRLIKFYRQGSRKLR